MGSAWIVLEVWYFSNKRHYVYHKIISAMALNCILVSIWYFVADWAEEEHACRVQGYFVQLSLAPLLYFAMLFLYYMLVITVSVPEQRLVSNSTMDLRYKWLRLTWQQIFHILPFVVSVVTASASLPLDLFHPSHTSSWCWIAVDASEIGLDEEFRRVSAFQWGFYLGPCWFTFGSMMVALVMVFRGVETQEMRMKKYIAASTVRKTAMEFSPAANAITPETNSTWNSRNDSTSMCSVSLSTVLPDVHPVSASGEANASESATTLAKDSSRRTSSHDSKRRRFFSTREYWEHRPRTRQVFVQCLCYVGAFFWSTIFLTVNEIIVTSRNWGDSKKSPVPYALLALQCIYQPLLGLFIFLAYRRPFYMRMRREGFSRGLAVWMSCKWNQNPVERPGRRNLPSRRNHMTKLPNTGAAESNQREKLRQIVLSRRIRVKETHRLHHSEPSARPSSVRRIYISLRQLWPASSTNSIHSGEDAVEVQAEFSQGTSALNAGPARKCVLESKEDSGIHLELNAFDRPAESGLSQQHLIERDRSFLAPFECDDEQSLSLEDLVEEKSALFVNEGKSQSEIAGDLEAQTHGDNHSAKKYHIFVKNESKGDFDLIKQSSETYQDLVFMEIFPEADGAVEEKWRSIEARVRRYEKTKHDKFKMNMSVPVMSERHFDSSLRLPGPQELDSQAKLQSPTTRGNIRFAWAKNPLFKTSGRQNGELISPSRPKVASPRPSDGLDTNKSAPKRTSSGGYFSSMTKSKPDEKFLEKLEKEKSRQSLLQVISSRRVRSEHCADEEVLRQLVDSTANDEATETSQPAHRSVSGGPIRQSSNSSSDTRTERGVSSDDPQHRSVSAARMPPLRSGNQSTFLVASRTRNSNRSLDDIPELSEHSERGAMRGRSNNRDKPPKVVQKRISSGELSLGGDVCDSSNEFTARSAGSSIRTIKRSNRQGSFETGHGQRHSHSSELTSDEVSLVSDGPMSDDGFSSDSSWDDGDSRDEKVRGKERPEDWKTRSRPNNSSIRASLEEMERVSERSIEDLGASSSSMDLAE